MLKLIAAAAIVAFAVPSFAAPVTDCKVLVGKDYRSEDGVKNVDLVLPVKGKGVLDFHFSFASGHARLGGDTVTLAVCKVGEENGKPIYSTVYRAKVEDGRASIAIAKMPEKGTAKVSVVVGGETYFGTVSADDDEVTLGTRTATHWKAGE